jgi:uncharacterized protein YkvS
VPIITPWILDMPVREIEKPDFFYLAYRKRGFAEFIEFKDSIESAIQKDKERDIIVDLSQDYMITEEEIELLAKVIGNFHGTSRHLRIIANNSTKQKLETMNLFRTGNIFIYENPFLAFTSLMSRF